MKTGNNTDVVFAAISSSPLLLAKAGVLTGKKFTAGFFMQMTEVYSFIGKENFVHQGIVCDDNKVVVIDRQKKDWAGITFPGGHVG